MAELHRYIGDGKVGKVMVGGGGRGVLHWELSCMGVRVVNVSMHALTL